MACDFAAPRSCLICVWRRRVHPRCAGRLACRTPNFARRPTYCQGPLAQQNVVALILVENSLHRLLPDAWLDANLSVSQMVPRTPAAAHHGFPRPPLGEIARHHDEANSLGMVHASGATNGEQVWKLLNDCSDMTPINLQTCRRALAPEKVD